MSRNPERDGGRGSFFTGTRLLVLLAALAPGSVEAGRYYLWEGFEREINWEAKEDSAATARVVDPEFVSEGSQSLKLTFNAVTESARAVYDREQDLDWSPYGALVFDVYNPTDLEGLRIGFVIATTEKEIGHEAVTGPLAPGWNRNIRIALTEPIFKTAAADYRPVGYLVGRGDVREVKFLVYPGAPARGAVHLDNVRLERAGLLTRGDLSVNTTLDVAASAGAIGYVSPEIRIRGRDLVALENFETGQVWASGAADAAIAPATDLHSDGSRGLSVSFPASPDGFEVAMTGMENRLAGTGQLWMRVHNAGRDVSVALKLVDADGNEYESERRKLGHGWNTLLFDFTNANAWTGGVVSEAVLRNLAEVVLSVESRYAGRLVIDGLSGGDLALKGTARTEALMSVSYNPHENVELIVDTEVEDVFYGARPSDTRDAGAEGYVDGAVLRADVGSVRTRALYRRKITAFDNPVKSFIGQNTLGTELAAFETSGRVGSAQVQAIVASQLEYDRYNSHQPTGLGPLDLMGARVRYGLGRGWRVGSTWVSQQYRYGRGASGMPGHRQIWAADLDSYTSIGEGSLWWGAEGAVSQSGEEEVSTYVKRKEPYYAGTSITPEWRRFSLSYKYEFDGYHFGGNRTFHWGGVEVNLDGLPVTGLLKRIPIYDGSFGNNLVCGASVSDWASRDRQADAISGKMRPRSAGRSAAFTIGNDYQARPNFFFEIEANEEEDPWYRTPGVLESLSVRFPLPVGFVASGYFTWRHGWERDKSSDEQGEDLSASQSLGVEWYSRWNLSLRGDWSWNQSRQSWEGEASPVDRYVKFSTRARQTVGASTVVELSYGYPALFGSDYGVRGTIDVWTLTLRTYF